MAVRLVALDIDGTLIPLREGGNGAMPSQRIRRAIAALGERGVAVVLASGRMFPGTAEVARNLRLSTPVICQQGCSVHTLNGDVLHEFPIDHDSALGVVRFAREIERDYEWFNPQRYLASRESEATREYSRLSGIVAEYRRDPENAGVRATGTGIISTAEAAAGIHRGLVAHFGESLHLLDFPTVTVAVAPDANKGHALSLICEDLGISRHETVAIGDSVNDASMLAWAGRGIALGHSDRYALDAADEVLAEDEPEAVARFLEALARTRAG